MDWAYNNPDGKRAENCIELYIGKNQVNDLTCSQGFCSVCDIPSTPSITVRGSCRASILDTGYSWTGEQVLHKSYC